MVTNKNTKETNKCKTELGLFRPSTIFCDINKTKETYMARIPKHAQRGDVTHACIDFSLEDKFNVIDCIFDSVDNRLFNGFI